MTRNEIKNLIKEILEELKLEAKKESPKKEAPKKQSPPAPKVTKKLDQTGDGKITTGDAVIAARKAAAAERDGKTDDAAFLRKVQSIVNKRLGNKV